MIQYFFLLNIYKKKINLLNILQRILQKDKLKFVYKEQI